MEERRKKKMDKLLDRWFFFRTRARDLTEKRESASSSEQTEKEEREWERERERDLFSFKKSSSLYLLVVCASSLFLGANNQKNERRQTCLLEVVVLPDQKKQKKRKKQSDIISLKILHFHIYCSRKRVRRRRERIKKDDCKRAAKRSAESVDECREKQRRAFDGASFFFLSPLFLFFVFLGTRDDDIFFLSLSSPEERALFYRSIDGC